MNTLARRIGIAAASFVVAWIAIGQLAIWVFGSGNFLVWVLATVVAFGVYLEVWRRDRRAAGATQP